MTNMNMKRSYTMTTRAESAERTRTGILEAAFELSNTIPISAISLENVAAQAGVSVQTVLRRFGSKAGLFEEALAYANAAVVDERRAPVGDVDAALRIVVDHYELRGGSSLLLLAQEESDDQVRRVTDLGKATHRRWVEDVFAPYLTGDEALVDLLVVATDVYTWKLLRRDRGLSRHQTQHRMRQLVTGILAGAETITETR
jgi:AcrR family transcriptional regulator